MTEEYMTVEEVLNWIRIRGPLEEMENTSVEDMRVPEEKEQDD